MIPRIALTSGEPAGIGPELCLALASQQLPCELVCLGDRALLEERARALALPVHLRPYARTASAARAGIHATGELAVADLPLAAPSVPGRPNPANARYVLALLDRAIEGALAGEFDALVTAPVHKGVINDAGIAFSGHTEYLQQRTHSERAVMLLTSGTLRVALATTHLPLRAVSDALSVELLCQVAAILARELGTRASVMVIDTAPATKLRAIERLGASIIPASYDECWRTVEAHASRAGRGQTLVLGNEN